MGRLKFVCGCLCPAVLLCGIATAFAEEAKYSFKKDETPTYEIVVRTEFPDHIKVTTGYLILRPLDTDATGQISLRYGWGVKVFTTITAGNSNSVSFGSLAPMFDAPAGGTEGFKVTIDPKGKIIQSDAPMTDAQLEGSQGPAWKLVLQPLPPLGQTNWTAHQAIKVYEEKTQPGPGGFPMRVAGRTEHPETQDIAYTAGASQDGRLVIKRHYDQSSLEKNGETPVNRMYGDGQYTFDLKRGRIVSLEWKLSDEFVEKNLSVKLPISVNARLIPDDELAKIKSDIDAAEAKRKEAEKVADARRKENDLKEAAEREAHGKQFAEKDLPDGMKETEVFGATKGGGPFAIASEDRQPLLGFRVKTSEFGGRRCINVLDPLFKKPEATTEKADKSVTVVMAREGYVVGSITVNAGDFLNAFCVTFMKKTESGCDPKQSYVSPWYGKKVGTSQKKLGGKGQLVYGICGRKGLNVDAIGLVMEDEPGDDSDKK